MIYLINVKIGGGGCFYENMHTIRADKLSLFASAALRTSSILILPLASVPTVMIFIPHIAALAGFVPCADTGMMHTFL